MGRYNNESGEFIERIRFVALVIHQYKQEGVDDVSQHRTNGH